MSEIGKKPKPSIENKPEENQEDQAEGLYKKTNPINETDFSKKQESRMMNFFNQEFFDRKIDFKPK